MSPHEAKALAASRRAELRLRARRIRRAVAAGAAVVFVALFLVVYVQLASGHDPALSHTAKVSSTSATHEAVESSQAAGSQASTSEAESRSSESEASAGESSGAESSSSGESAQSESPSSVTTSQS
jgi:hypothetical protein